MPDTRIVTASVKENVAYMNQILPVKDSFDKGIWSSGSGRPPFSSSTDL